MVALGALLVGCATPSATPSATLSPSGTQKPKAARPAAQPIVVLHTNDNWGEVEPCG